MGLSARRWLQRHIALLFRLQLAGGIGLLSVLAGWSFDLSVRNVGAIGVLLFAQLLSVSVAARLFRHRTDGPLISFWMYGNPTFWTAPVAAAAIGAEAAVFVIAYDMLTQARIALGVRFLRRHAPKSQSRGTALADYAPTYGALAGLLLGLVLPAPGFIDTFVAALGIVMAAFGALLVGVAWPKRWIGTPQVAMALQGPGAAPDAGLGRAGSGEPRHRPARRGVDPRARPDPARRSFRSPASTATRRGRPPPASP